jgi:hypothetical protein
LPEGDTGTAKSKSTGDPISLNRSSSSSRRSELPTIGDGSLLASPAPLTSTSAGARRGDGFRRPGRRSRVAAFADCVRRNGSTPSRRSIVRGWSAVLLIYSRWTRHWCWRRNRARRALCRGSSLCLLVMVQVETEKPEQKFAERERN